MGDIVRRPLLRRASSDLRFRNRRVTLSVPANNAFNHLGGPVLVAYDFTSDFGPVVDSGPTETSFISAGVKGVLPRGWQINLSAAYSKASTDFVES